MGGLWYCFTHITPLSLQESWQNIHLKAERLKLAAPSEVKPCGEWACGGLSPNCLEEKWEKWGFFTMKKKNDGYCLDALVFGGCARMNPRMGRTVKTLEKKRGE